MASIVLAAFLFSLALMIDPDIVIALEQISPDQKISNPKRVIQTFYLFFIALSGIILLTKGALLYFPGKLALLEFSPLVCILFCLTLILMVVNFDLDVTKDMYREDGILENMTVVFLFLAVILFIIMGIKIKKITPRIFFLSLGIFALIFGMEEISWGQRIFGWETPEELKVINRQGESNLHNVFNHIFDLIYAFLNIILGCLFLYRDWVIKMLNRFSKTRELIPYYPSKKYFFVGFIFMLLLPYTIFFDQRGETFEETLALLIFVYAADLFFQKYIVQFSVKGDIINQNI